MVRSGGHRPRVRPLRPLRLRPPSPRHRPGAATRPLLRMSRIRAGSGESLLQNSTGGASASSEKNRMSDAFFCCIQRGNRYYEFRQSLIEEREDGIRINHDVLSYRPGNHRDGVYYLHRSYALTRAAAPASCSWQRRTRTGCRSTNRCESPRLRSSTDPQPRREPWLPLPAKCE